MTVYERIESLRKSKGLSQGKLEKELGFSNGSVSKWRNSKPTTERLQKVADFFKVSIEYLMTGKEAEREEKINIDNGDITNEINKLMFDIDFENKEIFYDGKPISSQQAAILRNALEIAFANLEATKKDKNKSK